MRLDNFKQQVIHPSVEVFAGGWKSTIGQLFDVGYKFEVASEPYRDEYVILIKNPNLNMIGKYHIDRYLNYSRIHVEFPYLYFPPEIILKGEFYRSIMMSEMHFEPLNVGTVHNTEVALMEYRSVESTSEIIVTPEDIPDLLSKIREAQYPKARELLHKHNKQAGLTLQAKILTFG